MIKQNLRTIIFGIEDSLVSTTGVIVGLIATGASEKTVLAAGLITIIVEATSMGAGEFISNDENPEKDKEAIKKGILMLTSYLIAGIWVMLPLFFNIQNSLLITTLALASFFILGLWRGAVLKGSKLKFALRTLLIGGIACVFGIAVGLLLR
jgi:VIT1/CCC1 family predicted Fe2+/Mn2+ transporter